MATIRLPSDFKEFLGLLNSEKIEYLLVGGYAVGHYGYPRATGDLDVWVAIGPANTDGMRRVLEKFGFRGRGVSADILLEKGKVLRMGVPPLRIDLVTTASGVQFAECYARRTVANIDGVDVNVVSREDLIVNKRACGRAKDLDDVEHLAK